MSKCISAHGEYSSHTPGRDAICTHCGVFDLDAWLVAHDAEVAAKALEDAADDLAKLANITAATSSWMIVDNLRARAQRIREGA